MTNPNYSGVTIQIANPAVNLSPQLKPQNLNGCNNPHCCLHNNIYPTSTDYFSNYNSHGQINQQPLYQTHYPENALQASSNIYPRQNFVPQNQQPLQGFQSYPVQYYLNNYNGNGGQATNSTAPLTPTSNTLKELNTPIQDPTVENVEQLHPYQGIVANNPENVFGLKNSDVNKGVDSIDYTLPKYDIEKPKQENQDFTKSTSIINDIKNREEELKAEKKNTKEKQIVALTDEYINSLENYLNNPNQEIRLMASKEILTRLDEDKSRYDDAALNALLNKMLQDPSKLIRVASLSAFNAQLASGNDYTVHLLHSIQQNPSADKEDVLQAADVLLKLSAGKEIKHIPNPEIKEKNNGEK